MKVKIWVDGVSDLNNDEIWLMAGKPNYFRSKGERNEFDGTPYTIVNPVGSGVSIYRETPFPVDQFMGAAAYRYMTEIKPGDLMQFVIFMRASGPMELNAELFIQEIVGENRNETKSNIFPIAPTQGWLQFQVTHEIVKGGECLIQSGVNFLTSQEDAQTPERVEYHLDEPNLLLNEL